MKRQRPHRPSNPLLYGPLRGHWRTYLVPALGGAAVTSVYSIVDTIAIGYGVGPSGAAAAAVLIPSFGLMAFLGTLLGMGGAILLATARGDAGPAAQRWVQRGVPDRPSAAPGARRGVAGPHRDGVADVAPGPAAASPTLGTRNPTLTLQTMKGPRFPPGAFLL